MNNGQWIIWVLFWCNRMSLCDGKKDREQLKMIKSTPEPCAKHKNQPISFICRTCIDAPLLCSQCVDDHQNHDWINYEDFFTEEVVDLFRSGYSPKGQSIDAEVDRLIDLIIEYSARIEQRLKTLQITIIEGLENFKKRFPLHNNYEFKGNKIDNRNMSRILQIVKNQNTLYSCERLKRTFHEILDASEEIIDDNFKKIEASLEGHEWERVKKDELNSIEKTYLSYFGKEQKLSQFQFSLGERNPGIRMESNRLVATYIRQIPKRPAILVSQPLSPKNNEVMFKITKMSKNLMFWNATTVYLGVCVPEIAETFSYLNLCTPSKGGYFISSGGRCYHSKLPEFDDAKGPFSFGLDDIVTVSLDFSRKAVRFYKKTAGVSIHNKFEMNLALDDNYMKRLKACVMFSEEEGAQVTIMNLSYRAAGGEMPDPGLSTRSSRLIRRSGSRGA